VKILIFVSALLLVAFLAIASIAPFRNSLLSNVFPKYLSSAAGNGSVGLLPSVIANQGQTFTTPVMINTAGADIVGVDIELNFDKAILELTDITTYPQNSSLNEYIPFDSTTSTPAEKAQYITNANNFGVVAFSALTGPEDRFNGSLGQSNPLALLQFKVLSNTPTFITFNFTPGSSIDTNLTTPSDPEPTDILSIVTNLSVNGPPVTYPEISPNPSPSKVGDISGITGMPDNKVDIWDYNQLLTDFNMTGSNLRSDIEKGGTSLNKVDIFDYNLLLTNFGQ